MYVKVSTKLHIAPEFRDFSPKYIARFEAISEQLAHRATSDYATGVAYHALPREGAPDEYTMTQFGVWVPADGKVQPKKNTHTLVEFDSTIPMADDRARRVVLLLRRGFNRQAGSSWLETVRMDQTRYPRIGGEALAEEGVPNVYKEARLAPEKLNLFFERAMRYVDWCASDDFPKGTPYEY